VTSCVVHLTVPVITVVHTGLPALSVSVLYFVTFCVSCRRCKMYCGHARLCVCVCVCLSVCLSVSVCGRMPTLLHGPRCNLGAWWRLPPSCALLGGFAIGAPVALLWQHNENPSLHGVSARC